jgi:hypothetical protein
LVGEVEVLKGVVEEERRMLCKHAMTVIESDECAGQTPQAVLGAQGRQSHKGESEESVKGSISASRSLLTLPGFLLS